MGRPPNHGSGSRFMGDSRERHPRRYFSLPIPPVDSNTFNAVQNYIREREPCLVHRLAWDQARSKADRLQEEVEALQRRLDELNEEKKQAIRDIEDTRDEQLERTLQKMERKIRNEHEREQKERDEQLEKELEAERERFEQEKEKVVGNNDEISSPSSKRRKLNPESKETPIVTGNEKIDSDSSDLEEGELTEGDTEEVSNEKHSNNGKGDPTSATDEKNDAVEAQKGLESPAAADELKKLETQIDNLKETKSNMVWLLRQVIIAEKKRKDKESKNS